MNLIAQFIIAFWLIAGNDTTSVSIDTLPHDTITIKLKKYMTLSGVRVKNIVKGDFALEMMAEDGYHIVVPEEFIRENKLMFVDSINGKPLDPQKYGEAFVVPLDTAAHNRMLSVKKLKWIKTLKWPFTRMPDTVFASNEQMWQEVISNLPDSEMIMVIACDSMKLAFPASFFKNYTFVRDTGVVGEFVDFRPQKGKVLNISDPAWLIIDTSRGYLLNSAPELVFGDTVSAATLFSIIDYDRVENYTFRIGNRTFKFNGLGQFHIKKSGKSMVFDNGVISAPMIVVQRRHSWK